MMKRVFNIGQLKYANEICYHDRFLALCEKHIGDGLEVCYAMDFKKHGGLLGWIFHYSRADYALHLQEGIDNILADLIKDYA